MESYKEALGIDKEERDKYYASSVQRKTEQQKRLESLLRPLRLGPVSIADIACGGGGASFHLSKLYPKANYTLVDANETAIVLARQVMQNMRASCMLGDIYALPLESESFDLVICWQTLSWIDEPEIALRELLRICKPGARVFASSLFNVSHDVDVYSRVHDQTRPSGTCGLSYAYNTYSLSSVRRWVAGLVSHLQVHEFNIPIDLTHVGKGLGTYTVRLDSGNRLQLSAGMLLNWGILELRK